MSDSIFLTDGNGSLTGLVDRNYSGELIIPEYVGSERITKIGGYTNGAYTGLSGYTGLTSVVIPDSVTFISAHAFENCTNLVSVNIPNGVTEIHTATFMNCTSLTSVTIPNSITSIGQEAFYQSGLTSIVIPDSVTNLTMACFYGCASLTSVTLPNSNCGYGRSCFAGCTSLTTIIFPEEGEIYLDGTFMNCTSLTSVTIPDSVVGIYDGFVGCTSLTTIYVPDPNNLSKGINSCDWLDATGNEVVFLPIPDIQYLINKKTLTNLADKIRVLSGSEDAMTPAVMANELDEFNSGMDSELATQDDLIAKIAGALEGKTLPDSDSASTVSFTVTRNDYGAAVYYINSDNQIIKTTDAGTYHAKGGIVVFTTVNQYTYSPSAIAFMNIDDAWAWKLAVVPDGWQLTQT